MCWSVARKTRSKFQTQNYNFEKTLNEQYVEFVPELKKDIYGDWAIRAIFHIELKNLIVEKTKLADQQFEGLKRDRVHGVPSGEQAGAGDSPR